jgi:hypothetical protein
VFLRTGSCIASVSDIVDRATNRTKYQRLFGSCNDIQTRVSDSRASVMVSSASGSEESLIMYKQEWVWRSGHGTHVNVCGSGHSVMIQKCPCLRGLDDKKLSLIRNLGMIHK